MMNVMFAFDRCELKNDSREFCRMVENGSSVDQIVLNKWHHLFKICYMQNNPY